MIEHSKPETIYPYNYPYPYNLKVDDIDGCQVGSKNRINKFQSQFEYNLNTKDIPGALAGSLKKGIVTERNTNPINPKYKYIGGVELGNKFENDPYGKSSQKKEVDIKSIIDKNSQNNIYKESMPNINQNREIDVHHHSDQVNTQERVQSTNPVHFNNM
jgi:hypothetical protein